MRPRMAGMVNASGCKAACLSVASSTEVPNPFNSVTAGLARAAWLRRQPWLLPPTCSVAIGRCPGRPGEPGGHAAGARARVPQPPRLRPRARPGPHAPPLPAGRPGAPRAAWRPSARAGGRAGRRMRGGTRALDRTWSPPLPVSALQQLTGVSSGRRCARWCRAARPPGRSTSSSRPPRRAPAKRCVTRSWAPHTVCEPAGLCGACAAPPPTGSSCVK
jgi:hypothetical protein